MHESIPRRAWPFLSLALAAAACRTEREARPPAGATGYEGSATSSDRASTGRTPRRTIPASSPEPSSDGPRLELVASFEHQVTGVAVSEGARVFVNFPRWTEDVEVSVAEIGERGALKPYPDERWNAWRNSRKDELPAGEHWVCVQSVFADGRGSLWVLDPAAPALTHVVAGGPKLVRIDLAEDRVARTIAFDEGAAPQGSYLNDVRIGPDGAHAYITDSGAKGALLVVDLASGGARRVLEGHPSTQPEEGVSIEIDGRELRRTDGRKPEFAADGIALSADGEHLYWQALTGETLYRIATEALRDESLSGEELGRRVERVGRNGVADGLWIDGKDRMYVSALEENAVKVRDGERFGVLVRSDELRWPDSFAMGPDGALYVTASRIMDSRWFDPEAGDRLTTHLFRVPLGSAAIEGSSPIHR